MDGELGEQAVRLVLAADDAHRLGARERRPKQPVRDQLGHRIGDAHREAHRLPGRPALHRLEQLPSETEDLVGVAEHQPAHVREHEPPAGPREELLTQHGLERAQLGAHRWLGQPQLRRGARHAPMTRHDPEVEEVVVVEPLHGATLHASAASRRQQPSRKSND